LGEEEVEADTIDILTIRTLNEFLTDLDEEIQNVHIVVNGSRKWATLQSSAQRIYQLSANIRDKLPDSKKKKKTKKSYIHELCKHASFMQRYAFERNISYFKSNFGSLIIDLKNVREEIERLGKNLITESKTILPNLDFITDVDQRSYIEESNKCLQVGAYRASVVMAGCALESMVRATYKETKNQDSSKLPFSRVIQVLEEEKRLSPDQSAIVSICRSFRNLTGHPSGFKSTKEDSSGILSLTIEQLRKRNS